MTYSCIWQVLHFNQLYTVKVLVLLVYFLKLWRKENSFSITLTMVKDSFKAAQSNAEGKKVEREIVWFHCMAVETSLQFSVAVVAWWSNLMSLGLMCLSKLSPTKPDRTIVMCSPTCNTLSLKFFPMSFTVLNVIYSTYFFWCMTCIQNTSHQSGACIFWECAFNSFCLGSWSCCHFEGECEEVGQLDTQFIHVKFLSWSMDVILTMTVGRWTWPEHRCFLLNQ